MICKIMSGLTGAGKSTYIKKFFPEAKIFSADDYFIVDEVYKYDKSKISLAHSWCLKKFVEAVYHNMPFVVVDNTNTTLAEIVPYYRVAECFGYKVEIIRIYCDPILAWSRNTHGVPLETVISMHKNMLTESLPPWYNTKWVA